MNLANMPSLQMCTLFCQSVRVLLGVESFLNQPNFEASVMQIDSQCRFSQHAMPEIGPVEYQDTGPEIVPVECPGNEKPTGIPFHYELSLLHNSL